MTRGERRDALIAFFETIRRPDASLAGLADDTSLVQTGLIDSFAMLELIGFLESEMGIDLRAAPVDPGELDSLGGILDLIARHDG